MGIKNNSISKVIYTITNSCIKDFPLVIFRLPKLKSLNFNAYFSDEIMENGLIKSNYENYKIFKEFGLDEFKYENLIQNYSKNKLNDEELMNEIILSTPRLINISFDECKFKRISQTLTQLSLQNHFFEIIDHSIGYLINLSSLE